MDVAPFKHLTPGADFIVRQDFTDYEGILHTAGERWTYRGKGFLPYEDGLSLFVVMDGVDHHVRLQWRPEEQGPIIDALDQYVASA